MKTKKIIALAVGCFCIYEIGRLKGSYDVKKTIKEKLDSYVSGYFYVDNQLENTKPDVYLDLNKDPDQLNDYVVFKVRKVKNKKNIR